MRILVTGGAGFIGSHVADGFRGAGHEVAIVDDLSTGTRANLDPAFKLYQYDIRDPSLETVFTDFRPEIVDHHAAQANVPASLVDPVADASINVLGGLNLLRLAAAHGVRKFIYISSGGAMYGEPDPRDLPVSETAPVRPLSPYGASKHALEAWLGVYQRTFGLDFTILRYANIYGPRQGVREEGAVVAVFATRMAADQPVTIDGNGQQTRDFVYVGDCVTANVAALDRGSGLAVNIGTGRETSIREVFDSMAEVAGHTHQPNFGPARKGDVVRIVLNPGLAREHLGWEAAMPLHDGLARTYKFFSDGVRYPGTPDSRADRYRVPPDTFVAILAGGEGTRLWPLSRSRRPKQLLQLSGDRSLIQQTVDRLKPLVAPERILIVTEASHAADLHAQLPELPLTSIVVEPTRRGTAAAVLLAALHVRARAPDATWASIHADAFITDDDEFRRTLAAAVAAADDGENLVTTGVAPRFPSTGYGYIQRGEALRDVEGFRLCRVVRFVEKPNLEMAMAYVQSGDYLWNPGVFVWRNTTLLDAFKQHQPAIYATLTSVPLDQIDEVYPDAPRQTIDVGIMEKAANVATLPANFGWHDIGSWSELWEMSPHDAEGNVAGGAGGLMASDSTGNMVFADGRTVALVGVDDLVVVETADAVFVCRRERAQDVRMIVERLRAEGSSSLL